MHVMTQQRLIPLGQNAVVGNADQGDQPGKTGWQTVGGNDQQHQEVRNKGVGNAAGKKQQAGQQLTFHCQMQ